MVGTADHRAAGDVNEAQAARKFAELCEFLGMNKFDDGQLTVGKAILRAGGFADFANRRKVRLTRTHNPQASTPCPASAVASLPHSTEPVIFELDLVKILEQGRADLDIILQPDDAISVKARLFNF